MIYTGSILGYAKSIEQCVHGNSRTTFAYHAVRDYRGYQIQQSPLKIGWQECGPHFWSGGSSICYYLQSIKPLRSGWQYHMQAFPIHKTYGERISKNVYASTIVTESPPNGSAYSHQAYFMGQVHEPYKRFSRVYKRSGDMAQSL